MAVRHKHHYVMLMTTLSLSRRIVLLGAVAAAGAVWFGLPAVRRLVTAEFAFRPVPRLPGFRELIAGDVSRSLDPMAGLTAIDVSSTEPRLPAPDMDICEALFGPPVKDSPGRLSIASFSDYRCPYCRVLTPLLAEWQASDPAQNHVEWHEWPLLGDVSMTAARAALAAKRQNAYPAFHERLMRSAFVPTPGYLRDTAKRLGLDADRLLDDMDDPLIARQIATSQVLAAMFGFPGTPALVVGKTAVVGSISASDLDALIDLERQERDGSVC